MSDIIEIRFPEDQQEGTEATVTRWLVAEGDRVNLGQQIARMGIGPGRQPLLHFEIRRDGKPVDPISYLPRR